MVTSKTTRMVMTYDKWFYVYQCRLGRSDTPISKMPPLPVGFTTDQRGLDDKAIGNQRLPNTMQAIRLPCQPKFADVTDDLGRRESTR